MSINNSSQEKIGAGATESNEFDQYAENYDSALGVGLSWTGENREYFAQKRVEWLRDRLSGLQVKPQMALDFGCGTGSAVPFLFDILGVTSVIGVDISQRSLDVARRSYGSRPAQFMLLNEYEPAGQCDVAFCNGVFHHIPLNERAAAIQYIYRSLRPGGVFALWENNPWNPITRLLMSLAPIDRDAITLTPSETCRLLRSGNFEVLQKDFLFIFPGALRWFRGIEPCVSRFPLGIQYQVLAQKLPHVPLTSATIQ